MLANSLELSIGTTRKNILGIKDLTKILQMAHSIDGKIEFILKPQFRDLSMQTLAILQIMSVCNSKKIPEWLIQELFNSYFPEDDLLNYKNSLVN